MGVYRVHNKTKQYAEKMKCSADVWNTALSMVRANQKYYGGRIPTVKTLHLDKAAERHKRRNDSPRKQLSR